MGSLIRVFELNIPEIADTSDDPGISPKLLGGDITDTILNTIRSIVPSDEFYVEDIEINDRAQVHCEKWVEEVGYHFIRYSTALQTPTLAFPRSQRSNRRILKSKVYSGDVSGTIGEALFSLYLVKCFLLDDSDFAHLRADKMSGVYPDFAIYAPSAAMLSNFNWNLPLSFEIPAEVKSANEFNRQAIYPRLTKSIQQIRNFWNRRNTGNEPSLIGLTIRNQPEQTYDLVVIWR
jgi:hypothetical protein